MYFDFYNKNNSFITNIEIDLDLFVLKVGTHIACKNYILLLIFVSTIYIHIHIHLFHYIFIFHYLYSIYHCIISHLGGRAEETATLKVLKNGNSYHILS